MTPEQLADVILRAAGSKLAHYDPQSKERIIEAARAGMMTPVARCIQLVRELRDELCGDQGLVASGIARHIEDEFGLGTTEQRALLGLPPLPTAKDLAND
jgi:hypothetical protein